jgi:hypothetical protein
MRTTIERDTAPAARSGVVRALGRLLPFRAVVLPWLVSRAISDGLIIVMGAGRLAPPEYGGFAKWDGTWYAHISQLGYGPAPTPGQPSSWAFFPFLPGVMRAGSSLGVSPELAGVLINHLALLLALAGLYRIATRRGSADGARLAVWAIALFPAAFLFSMDYPSSIFLAASVWAFALVEDRHDLAAGLVAAAAVLVRPNGFVVALALAVAVRGSIRRVLLVCGPGALAFLGWCLYNLDRTGDGLAFFHAKSGWPEVTAIDFLNKFHKYAIPHLLLAAAAVVAVVLVARRLPLSWLVFTALYLLPPFALGIVGLGRYAGECFPPFVAAGEIMRKWRRAARACLFAASVLVQALCVYWVIHENWLP